MHTKTALPLLKMIAWAPVDYRVTKAMLREQLAKDLNGLLSAPSFLKPSDFIGGDNLSKWPIANVFAFRLSAAAAARMHALSGKIELTLRRRAPASFLKAVDPGRLCENFMAARKRLMTNESRRKGKRRYSTEEAVDFMFRRLQEDHPALQFTQLSVQEIAAVGKRNRHPIEQVTLVVWYRGYPIDIEFEYPAARKVFN